MYSKGFICRYGFGLFERSACKWPSCVRVAEGAPLTRPLLLCWTYPLCAHTNTLMCSPRLFGDEALQGAGIEDGLPGKSVAGVARALDARGFDVLRRTAFADDTGVLFFELAVAERPAIERHDGPPVSAREHAVGFYETYADADCYGPFVDGGRYVVERDREYRTASEFLENGLAGVALGAAIETALETGYEVLVGDEVGELADEFGVELARYFDPRP